MNCFTAYVRENVTQYFSVNASINWFPTHTDQGGAACVRFTKVPLLKYKISRYCNICLKN